MFYLFINNTTDGCHTPSYTDLVSIINPSLIKWIKAVTYSLKLYSGRHIDL